jgi:cell surface protein SprA
LSQANPFSTGVETNTGYFNGYNGNSQDVLIPSFLAAYGGVKANRVRLSPFTKIPLPNWDVNYNGLSDLDFMKELFKTVTLTHAYRSNYSVAYQTNLSAMDVDRNGIAENQYSVGTGLDIFNNPIELTNFYAIYNIQALTITEAFAPLIGLNFIWKNGITTTFDFKRNRNLMFNVGALQLNEMRNSELSIQFNWKKDKMTLPIQLFGKEMNLNNNLTFRFEFTLRNTKSSNRRLDSDVQEPTGGMLNYTIKPSIDYALSTRLTARMYYEYNSNRPVLNTSYPTRFSSFGFQFRFALN